MTAEASTRPGDLPAAVQNRYFSERSALGRVVCYFEGPGAKRAAFHDHGARLLTDQTHPAMSRDLVLIAAHRGWSTIRVRGEDEFRRQTWLEARALGLEVAGYRPRERDLQELERRLTDDRRRREARQRRHESRDPGEQRVHRRSAANPAREDEPIIVPPGPTAAACYERDPRTSFERLSPADQAERFRRETAADAARDPRLFGAQSHLAVLDTIIDDLVRDPARRSRLHAEARHIVAEELARGGRFSPARIRSVEPILAHDVAEALRRDREAERAR